MYLLADEDMNIEDRDTRTLAAEEIRKIYTEGLLQDDLAAAIQVQHLIKIQFPNFN